MNAPENPADYRAIWESKPILRAIYRCWYARMTTFCQQGRTLEIGGGSGNLKAFAPNVLSTDVLPAAWLDTVCDAQRLPFADESFVNIVMLDVLHHLERPVRFFDDASRVLKPGGRIVMLEPGITPVSHFFYHKFHHEPVDMTADAFADGAIDPHRDPYNSNQAIPTLLFGRAPDRQAFEHRFDRLKIFRTERLALIVYPLSGGFRSFSLLPGFLVGALTGLERVLAPLLGRLMAFRLMIVLEKRR